MKYNFDEVIDRTGTNSVKWDTFPAGSIPLFVADMDFASPPPVIEAVKKRVDHGVFGYTRPGEELYDAVFTWFRSEYGFELQKSWISWLPGIVPALAVASGMGKGGVLTNTPNYSMLLSAPKRAGKQLVTSQLKVEDGKYEIDFEDMERKFTPSVSTFLLCNPHNPVGRVYREDELLKVVEFCRTHNLTLVSDEIHCELVFDRPHIPIVTTGSFALENSITFMSPGKTYNLPGIPIAFAIIPNPDLKKRFEKAGYAMPHPGTLSYEVCREAYAGSGEWRKELLEYLKGNRDYLEQELKRRFPGVVYTHVEGTYLLWLDFRPLGIEDPFQFFYDRARVIFSNGRDFGGEGFVRLNFGCRRAVLEEALNRLERAVKSL